MHILFILQPFARRCPGTGVARKRNYLTIASAVRTGDWAKKSHSTQPQPCDNTTSTYGHPHDSNDYILLEILRLVQFSTPPTLPGQMEVATNPKTSLSSDNSSIPHQQHNNELLAPSLFWAFVPTALNAMTQPSGRIFGLHTYYSFALRISPIICGISAALTLTQVTYLTLIQKSFKVACLGVYAQRFKSTLTDGEQRLSGDFDRLRINSIFRIGLFVLGALPQSIKLFSSSGVAFAQACCAAFVTAFVTDEVILYISARATDASSIAYDDVWPSSPLYQRLQHRFPGDDLIKVLVLICTSTFCIVVTSKAFEAPIPLTAVIAASIACFLIAEYRWDGGL